MTPILKRPSTNASIDDLLRRRFGTLAPPPVTTLRNPRSAEAAERARAIDLARAEYEAMTPTQLQDLIEKVRRDDAEAINAKSIEEDQALFFNQPHANADYAYWSRMAIWKLDEGIALSLGKNPADVNMDSLEGDGGEYILAALARSPFRKEYMRRYELVSRALAVHDLRDPTRPETFLTWALNTFDSVPAELVEQVRARGKHIADMQALTLRVAELKAQLATNGTVTKDSWPWGGYETKWLRKLAAAAQRYWVNYDPSDPDTAATNKTVSDWLQNEQAVPDRVAQIMAQILRADGIRPGPRK